MYHQRVETEQGVERVGVTCHPGVSTALDQLAATLPDSHRFLRSAWYEAGQGENAITLLGWRGDGTPFIGLPSIGLGPSVIGARHIPGSYWPFRTPPVAPDATDVELAEFFAHPVVTGALAPAWRLGPVYADDPIAARIKRSAAMAGWTVLAREMGRTFAFDLTQQASWPRRSTRRRLANYERQLAQLGEVEVAHVRGADWTADTLDQLARIEAASWVGTGTDGSGAKFLTPARRSEWRRVLADPALAQALSATILSIGAHPIAFSFDLIAGETQYSIASSYDEAYAAFRPGKLVTARQLEIARALGVRHVDLGAGDSGYKREMGATPGARIVDLLIVRSRTAATLIQLKWGQESAVAREAYLTASALRGAGHEGRGRKRIESLLAIGALAAAMAAFAE